MFFPKADEELLERHGVSFVPTGEGPLFVRSVPVDALFFRDDSRRLTEDEFIAIFPAIQRTDPLRLNMNLPVTDGTVELLNRLRSTRVISVGPDVTMDGLRKLRLRPCKTLVIPQSITESHRRELQELMPGVTIQ